MSEKTHIATCPKGGGSLGLGPLLGFDEKWLARSDPASSIHQEHLCLSHTPHESRDGQKLANRPGHIAGRAAAKEELMPASSESISIAEMPVRKTYRPFESPLLEPRVRAFETPSKEPVGAKKSPIERTGQIAVCAAAAKAEWSIDTRALAKIHTTRRTMRSRHWADAPPRSVALVLVRFRLPRIRTRLVRLHNVDCRLWK